MNQRLTKTQTKRALGTLDKIGKYHKGSNPTYSCQINIHSNCNGKHMRKYGMQLACTCSCHKKLSFTDENSSMSLEKVVPEGEAENRPK